MVAHFPGREVTTIVGERPRALTAMVYGSISQLMNRGIGTVIVRQLPNLIAEGSLAKSQTRNRCHHPYPLPGVLVTRYSVPARHLDIWRRDRLLVPSGR